MLRWSNLILRLPLPLRENNFIILGIACILFSRIAIILLTPNSEAKEDINIYQATGQCTLEGVNPYNYADQTNIRQRLRAKTASANAYVAETQERWDSYVSSNLPASTALYAAVEKISQGSRFIWRLALILGDIGIFLGLVAFFRVARGGVTDTADQIGIFFLSVLFPPLLVSGTAIPEDKQFQTALMLFAAALLLSPKPSTVWRDLGTGTILSLAVLFKLFGIFLFPLWLARAIHSRVSFAVLSSIAGLIPLVLSFAAFGIYFIERMGIRASQNSGGIAGHASPWILLPWLSPSAFFIVKAIVIILLLFGLVALYVKKRIDLLNLCAGLAVIFACLWLQNGSINRTGITMMFAMASLVTISRFRFLALILFNSLVAALAYAGGYIFLKIPLENIDAVLTLVFLCSYGWALGTMGRENHAGSLQLAHGRRQQ
jgi:hypothetical protein